jgi:hypothetical protein
LPIFPGARSNFDSDLGNRNIRRKPHYGRDPSFAPCAAQHLK